VLNCWLQRTLLEPPFGWCRYDDDGYYLQSICIRGCQRDFIISRCGCRLSYMTGMYRPFSAAAPLQRDSLNRALLRRCYAVKCTVIRCWLREYVARTVVRTLVVGRRTFRVPRSTCSWRVTTYVGKPSAMGQLTRLTQAFVLPRSTNWVVSYIGCVLPRSGGAI